MKIVTIFILLIGACLSVLANRSDRQWKTSLEMSSFNYDYSGFLLDYGISILDSTTDNQFANAKYKRDFNQQTIKLGYITNDRYFMGLGYATDRYLSTDNGGANQIVENKNYMIGLGYYFQNNFFGHGYYVLQKDQRNDRSRSGYRLDLGYKINFSEYLFMTAVLSHQRTGPVWSTNPNVSLGLLIF